MYEITLQPNVEEEPEKTPTSPEEEAANIAKTTNDLTGEMAAFSASDSSDNTGGTSGTAGGASATAGGASGTAGDTSGTAGGTSAADTAPGVSTKEIGSYGQVLMNIGKDKQTEIDKTVQAVSMAVLVIFHYYLKNLWLQIFFGILNFLD